MSAIVSLPGSVGLADTSELVVLTTEPELSLRGELVPVAVLTDVGVPERESFADCDVTLLRELFASVSP